MNTLFARALICAFMDRWGCLPFGSGTGTRRLPHRGVPGADGHRSGESRRSTRNLCMIALAVTALGSPGILGGVDVARADDVPDALSVEWQGKKPCEKLFDDAHVRVARCTFPPGAVHVCHSHPGYLSYVVSGGQGQVQDEKGIRKIDVTAGALFDVPPTPWHEFANVGDTTIQYIIVEKKYQVAPPVSQTACPKGTWPRSQ